MIRRIRGWLKLYLLLAIHDNIITISKSTRHILKRRYPFLDAKIVYPGICLPQTAPKRAVNTNLIVTIGRLVRRKGFDVLLKSVARVRDEGIKCNLSIIGDGPDGTRLRQLTENLGLADNVTFSNNLSDCERDEQLRRSRFFCLLPRELPNGDIEGFGIVFLEAAASGLPILAGKSGGVPEAINNGVNGYLVDPEDIDAVTAKMKLLLTDDRLCTKMSRESRKWARKFAWDNRDPQQEFCFL
ncbi:MAG: glycosyltransferase [Kiritimatiellia bacterium]